MKKAVVVFHKVDYDGIFSCCEVVRWLEKSIEYIDWDLVGYDYSDKELPDYKDWPNLYDTLIMVDVSFPPESMVFLKDKMREFIYEDHHAVNIDNSIEYGYDNLKGIRDINFSAAENTWKDLFGNEVPMIIQYVSALDIWNKDRFDWNLETVPIQLALKVNYGVSYHGIIKVFSRLIKMNMQDLKDKFINQGLIIKKYEDKKDERSINKYAFEVTVDEKYTAIAILGTDFTSSIFDSIYDRYSLFIIANRLEENRFKISLYGKESEEITDFSCGDYCKSLGGGGHKLAASCIVDRSVFDKLIYDCKL